MAKSEFSRSVPAVPTIERGPAVPFKQAVRQVPTREPTIQGDVTVPFFQSCITSVVFSLTVGVISVAAGGPWWAGVIALGVVFIATWLWLLFDSRQLLRSVETIIGRDIDGDGVVGLLTAPAVPTTPTTVRVETVDREARQMRYVDLPVGDDVLEAVAVAVLDGQRPFSRRGLSGIVSEGDFNRLSGAMLEGGLARYRDGKPQSGIELTGSGRAVLQHYL